MKIFILIVLLSTGTSDGGVAIQMQEFNSSESCMAAKGLIDSTRLNTSSTNLVKFPNTVQTYCTEK